MRRRYIQIDGVLHEVALDYVPPPRESAHVMGDIKPYRSQIDGTVITSRSRHREHLKQHGCIEVGNDSALGKQRPALESPPGRKELIARLVYDKLRY
jgi:hypothetical protein